MMHAGRTAFQRWVNVVPAAVVLGMVAILFVLHVVLALKYPYFNQFSNVEDWAYTNIAARNYLRFGFLPTFFLQDYSASLFAADHPFIYNHMPPGPDLLTAVFLMLTRGDHHWTRILFGALVLPGMYYYVRFVRLLLGSQDIPGAALALLAAGPYVVVNHLQAEVHSAYLLLCFAPMCWVIESHADPRRWRLPAALALTFLLSIYIQYILLAAALFAWIFLYLLRLAPISRKQIVLIVATIFAGIGAHLLQNLIYLGPELFAKELLYTLGNRTIGVPTQEELRNFYIDAGLVHHGAQRADPGFVALTLASNLKFRFAALVLPALVALVAGVALARRLASRFEGFRTFAYPACGLGEEIARAARFILRLFAWAALTIVAVILLFPAHTQEVNLSSYGAINLLLFGVPATALVSTLLLLGRPLLDAEGRTLIANAFPPKRRLALFAWIFVGAAIATFYVIGRIWPMALEDRIVARLWNATSIALWPFAAAKMPAGASIIAYASPALGIVIVILCWWRYRPMSGSIDRSASYWTLIGAVTRSVLLFAAIMSVVAILTRAANELGDIMERAAGANDLEPLVSLQQYKGQLFMTNINVPSIGYFAESPGYGVCGRDSIRLNGELERVDCKVAQMRRQEYWSAQRPEYFFYFKQGRVFPGFATCWPRDAFIGIARGGAGCNEELGERLAAQYKAVASNVLFDVYDLRSR